MRSPIAFVLVLLGILLVAAPQRVAAQEFGVLVGATFSEIKGDDVDDDLGGSTGLLAGVLARIRLGEIITFQPEVQYAQKGAESEGATAEASVTLSYLDVPLFLSFGFPGSFHALVGPNFSFEVSCSLDIDVGNVDVDNNCDQDDSFDDRKSFVGGVTVGVGLDLPITGVDAFIDGRFNIDLESFAENDNVDVKNQAFELVGGVIF